MLPLLTTIATLIRLYSIGVFVRSSSISKSGKESRLPFLYKVRKVVLIFEKVVIYPSISITGCPSPWLSSELDLQIILVVSQRGEPDGLGSPRSGSPLNDVKIQLWIGRVKWV